jgi:hypothetical protein
LVDPAILRPGRFDTHIFVPPPNEEVFLFLFCFIKLLYPRGDMIFYKKSQIKWQWKKDYLITWPD